VKLVHQRREQAAQLVAEDRFPDTKIAEICEISEACLSKWKKRPEFAERVKELTAVYGDRVLKFGLARRERRLAVLSDVHEKILTLIDARAKDPEMAAIPGGPTGLLVKTNKLSRVGKALQVYEEFKADVGLLKELRAIEEQAARELGQWRDKHELSGAEGKPIGIDVSNMTNEQLREQLAKRLEKAGFVLMPVDEVQRLQSLASLATQQERKP
jgi:hypothetical protein